MLPVFVKSTGILSRGYDICDNISFFPETVTFPSSVSYLINIPLSHQGGSFTENAYLLQVYNSVEFINEFLNLEIIKICTLSLFNTIRFWKYP